MDAPGQPPLASSSSSGSPVSPALPKSVEYRADAGLRRIVFAARHRQAGQDPVRPARRRSMQYKGRGGLKGEEWRAHGQTTNQPSTVG